MSGRVYNNLGRLLAPYMPRADWG